MKKLNLLILISINYLKIYLMKLKGYCRNQIILDFQLHREMNIERKDGLFINLYHLQTNV